MKRDQFLEATNSMDWATIEDLEAVLDQHDYWDESFFDSAVQQAKRAHIRRRIKQVKDADGWPLIASVKTQNADGEAIQVYKQEALFDVDDYRQVYLYHDQRSEYHRQMRDGYARHAEQRYGVQIGLRGLELTRA